MSADMAKKLPGLKEDFIKASSFRHSNGRREMFFKNTLRGLPCLNNFPGFTAQSRTRDLPLGYDRRSGLLLSFIMGIMGSGFCQNYLVL
jgi:hypothetical protein